MKDCCYSRYYQYLEEARIGRLAGLVLLTAMHYFLRPVDHPATVLVRWYADGMIDRLTGKTGYSEPRPPTQE